MSCEFLHLWNTNLKQLHIHSRKPRPAFFAAVVVVAVVVVAAVVAAVVAVVVVVVAAVVAEVPVEVLPPAVGFRFEAPPGPTSRAATKRIPKKIVRLLPGPPVVPAGTHGPPDPVAAPNPLQNILWNTFFFFFRRGGPTPKAQLFIHFPTLRSTRRYWGPVGWALFSSLVPPQVLPFLDFCSFSGAGLKKKHNFFRVHKTSKCQFFCQFMFYVNLCQFHSLKWQTDPPESKQQEQTAAFCDSGCNGGDVKLRGL